MKKIFTFILLAISTLAMAQAFPSDPGILKAPADVPTDVITFDKVATDSHEMGVVYWSQGDVDFGTDARYYIMSMDNTTDYMTFDDIRNLITTTSAGKIKSVTIYWKNTQQDDQSKIWVYGSNTAYPDQMDESYETTGWSVGSKLGEFSFPGGANPMSVVTPSEKYQYVLIYGNGAQISQIVIEWNPITSFSINVITPIGGHSITLTDDIKEAEAGTKVEFKLKGFKAGSYEAQSYTLTTATGEETFDIDEKDKANIYTGIFTMPASAVSISAVFALPPSRTNNYARLQAGEGVLNETNIQITSGDDIEIHFAIDHAGTVIDKHTAPASATASITDWHYDKTAATGSFILHGWNQGNTSFTINTQQSDQSKPTSTTIHIAVVPREVLLVTKYGDKYYAAVNSISGGRLNAQEVNMSGETVVIMPTATYKAANLKWKVCTLNPATRGDKEEYTIQTPAGKILNIDLGGLGEFAYEAEKDAHTWRKNSDRFNYAGNGIVYYATDGNFAALSLLEHPEGVKEYAEYTEAEEVVIRSGLTANAFSTTCKPYSFIAGDGVSVYTIDDIETKADGRHIYFCRLEEGDVTEAGRPYVIKSTSNVATGLKIGNEGAEAKYYNDGLYGVMSNTYWKTLWTDQGDKFYNGNVLIFKGGKFSYVEYYLDGPLGGGLGANSACLLLSDIPTESSCTDASPSSAPRRVSMSIEQDQVATAVENILSADQINWNEPVYNIMGQRVARGTTGVLVQNGKKFIAE